MRVAGVQDGFNEAAGIPRGRPADRAGECVVGAASMRPRVFPAEDLRNKGKEDHAHHASMRPRVFPAEDASVLVLETKSGPLQ